MASHPDPISADYKAEPGFPVLLTVTAGNGQASDTAVWIDGKIHPKSEFNREPMGMGAAIKKIQVKSNVADVNPHTNKMTVVYLLEGGPNPLVKSQPFEVAQHGQSATFRALFNIKP